VATKLAEKDLNLAQEAARLWGEISTHTYLFDRQDIELELLKEITKEEFLNHFDKVFFSEETKRFDLELTSERHSEEEK
jgi:secreted Zn-dependent insulinase-like peptidase